MHNKASPSISSPVLMLIYISKRHVIVIFHPLFSALELVRCGRERHSTSVFLCNDAPAPPPPVQRYILYFLLHPPQKRVNSSVPCEMFVVISRGSAPLELGILYERRANLIR